MKRNKAHEFKVKFDQAIVIFIKAYGFGLLGMLIWTFIDIYNIDPYLPYKETAVIKFFPWYIGILLVVMILGNSISWIAKDIANKHFKRNSWTS